MEETTTKRPPVVFISGPITGVEKYWEAFEFVDDVMHALGCVVLNPSHLPRGLSRRDYMLLCFQMIDTADVVIFLKGWDMSGGAWLEHEFCRYIEKPCVYSVEEAREVLGV